MELSLRSSRLVGCGGTGGGAGQDLGRELFLTPLESGLTSIDPGCTRSQVRVRPGPAPSLYQHCRTEWC